MQRPRPRHGIITHNLTRTAPGKLVMQGSSDSRVPAEPSSRSPLIYIAPNIIYAVYRWWQLWCW